MYTVFFILVATILKLEVIIFGIVFGTNFTLPISALYGLKHEHGVIFRKNLATMNITVMN
ncbi:hypothetical protein T09_5234 [Trichinella sp. T9]|nr:hypothetical protein T09_5234 [Trichinella sp. T9]